jgi:hypothetical protein
MMASMRSELRASERDNATRIVELHRDDFPYPDTVEIDAATVAQAGGRALEDHAQGAARLGGVQALEPQHEAECRRDHRQGEGADQHIVRAGLHQLLRTNSRQRGRACH